MLWLTCLIKSLVELRVRTSKKGDGVVMVTAVFLAVSALSDLPSAYVRP